MGKPSERIMVRLRTTVRLVWLLVLATQFSLVAAAQPPAPGLAIALDNYVGRYELTPTFHLTVTREGRAIYLQATGQPRAPLMPRAGHEFVIVGSGLRVIFRRP